MKRTALVSLLASLLAFGVVGFAYAEPGNMPVERGARNGATIKGEVTAIDGSTLTVQTEHRGAVTVQTNDETRFRAKDAESFSLAGLKIGDVIAVKGRFDANGALAARLVALVPPELAGDAHGTVTAIDGNTITVEDKDGSPTTIITTGETIFRVKDAKDGSIDDVEVGMVVGAAGRFDDDGALIAKHVVAGEPRERQTFKHGPMAGGKVSEVNGGEFALAYPDGSTRTVVTDAATVVITRGQDGPALGSLSDVTEGARILALGIPSADGRTLTARVILLGRHNLGTQP